MKSTREVVIAIAMLAVAGAVPASAAVAVLGGGGLAKSCYRAAEFGEDVRSNLDTCNLALEHEALSTHDRASTLVNKGILQADLGQVVGALSDYNAALSIDQNLAEAYVDRGSVLIAMKRFDEALESLNTALRMKPAREEIAYYNRALAEEALGNIRAAYDDLKQATSIQPNFKEASEQLKRYKVVNTSDGI